MNPVSPTPKKTVPPTRPKLTSPRNSHGPTTPIVISILEEVEEEEEAEAVVDQIDPVAEEAEAEVEENNSEIINKHLYPVFSIPIQYSIMYRYLNLSITSQIY